mgnify:CR=1 FL=1
MSKVLGFSRKNDVFGVFSNFTESQLTYEGVSYTNPEAMFQSMKLLNKEQRKQFSSLSPATAKKMGRSVSLRDDWEEVKYDCMLQTVLARCEQEVNFSETLKHTGDSFIFEDTTGWHDNEWGCCSCDKCSGKKSKNMLGLALMDARARLDKTLKTICCTVEGVKYEFTIEDLLRSDSIYDLMNYICRFGD